MFFFHWFESFQPLHNPIGFGIADFAELFLAGIFVLFAFLARPFVEPLGSRLAQRTVVVMLVLAAVPVMLRLALLAHHPVPTPNAGDEFSHLLVADTLRHWRLANPVHPMRRFFETFFVLQTPSYSSIYPLGQGISMALGRLLFGSTWAGVLAATAAFCALTYWMLRAWTSAGWALLGGVLTVIEFGPLNHWMNSYWGGSFAAAGGCLVFGALPRVFRSGRLRDGVLLGVGLGISVLTRPYESTFLVLSVLVYVAFELRGRRPLRALLNPALACVMTLLPFAGLLLAQNRQITGDWLTMPYVLSQYQYGVPVSLTVQSNPTPHNALTPEQASEYAVQMSLKEQKVETFWTFIDRLFYRVRGIRFFFLPPLYLALIVFLVTARDWRSRWIIFTLVLFALGTNLFPAFHFHYVASVTSLFVLIVVLGLARMGPNLARVVILLCLAHFAFWYTAHIIEGDGPSPELVQQESWDALNHVSLKPDDPERRIAVRSQLDRIPGRVLIFVRYYPSHPSQDEWVWNDAAIDESRVVWARDLGDEEDRKLIDYYPGRSVWLLEPDFKPEPRFGPFTVIR